MDEKNLKDNLELSKGKNTDNTANNNDIHKRSHIAKAEKIGSAFFLLTGFMNDQEPIKWDIRQTATRLVLLLARTSAIDLSTRKKALDDASITTSELLSLVEICSLSGLVSKMNSEILSSELNSLSNTISLELSNFAKYSALKFPKNFFSVPDDYQFGLPSKNAVDNKLLGDGERSKSTENIIKDKITTTELESYKRGNLEEQDKKKIKEYGSVAIKRNKRQGFIIQALKRKKELTIKDISMIFNDCSEKTIQRELASLINDGIVVKEGERRWTKYSLALTA